jgi:hypothetical protein
MIVACIPLAVFLLVILAPSALAHRALQRRDRGRRRARLDLGPAFRGKGR